MDTQGKPVKLGTLERISLRKAVRGHVDIRKHVAKPADVNALPKDDLVALAEKLGIDIQATIQGDRDPLEDSGMTVEAQDLMRYSELHPAFTGELPFEVAFELFGHRVVRQARLNYAYTPDWEYFDLIRNEPMRGWDSSSFSIEVLTAPTGDRYDTDAKGKLRRRKAKPEWQLMGDLVEDGVLPEELFEEFYRRMDETAQEEDRARRNNVSGAA